MGFYENTHKWFGQVFEEGAILDCVACGCIAVSDGCPTDLAMV
jgi:hypothetical protein